MKSKPQLQPKSKPVARPPVKPAARVLQMPQAAKSSPSLKPTKQTSRPPAPEREKKFIPEWDSIHGLAKSDLPDLVERRQTISGKIKDLERKLGKKKEDPSYPESLNAQILHLLNHTGTDSVRVEERTVTKCIGHSQSRIVKDVLVKTLLAYDLDVEQIEEIIDASTEGGDPYEYLLVTEPKDKDDAD